MKKPDLVATAWRVALHGGESATSHGIRIAVKTGSEGRVASGGLSPTVGARFFEGHLPLSGDVTATALRPPCVRAAEPRRFAALLFARLLTRSPRGSRTFLLFFASEKNSGYSGRQTTRQDSPCQDGDDGRELY